MYIFERINYFIIIIIIIIRTYFHPNLQHLHIISLLAVDRQGLQEKHSTFYCTLDILNTVQVIQYKYFGTIQQTCQLDPFIQNLTNSLDVNLFQIG